MTPLLREITVTRYQDRHPDWYNGKAESIANLMGQVAHKTFFLSCDARAEAAKSFCGLIPIVGGAIGDFFVKMEQQHYERTATVTYDDGALNGCKFFEKVEAEIGAVLGQIQTQVDAAKKKIETDFINPLKTQTNQLKANVASAQASISSVTAAVNNAQARANTALDNANQALNNAKTAISQAQSAGSTASSALQQAQNAVSQAQSALSKVADVNKSIDSVLGDLKGKTAQITQLLKDSQAAANSINSLLSSLKNAEARIKALEQKAGATVQSANPSIIEKLKLW